MKPTDLSKPLLFISDLHLDDSRPDISASLEQFLKDHATQCQALYILGDLFEVWIGDDEKSELADLVANALLSFSQHGAEIYLMHGNRDFLMGEAYARRCGAQLLPEKHILHTEAGDYLLLHGDTLCTDDVAYQNFRAMVRNPAWQQEFLSQPIAARREYANQARAQSQAATSGKDQTIMDVNQTAVEKLLSEEKIHFLIHGHTHRPNVHHFTLPEPTMGEATRLVLGDWDNEGWYAKLQAGELSLHHFPLQQP